MTGTGFTCCLSCHYNRLSAADSTTKIERLRSELLRCVSELQAQLASSASAGQAQQAASQHLRAMEATAAAAREEAAEARQQLVELAAVTLSDLREQLAGEAVAITGLPDSVDAAQLPGHVASYIKVRVCVGGGASLCCPGCCFLVSKGG